jgi:hypothetical protein
MGEPDNGQRDPKPNRHNAKLCPFPIRQRIVNALANGDSKRAIARALRVSNNTVTAIAEQEWQQVEARKHRLAAQAERNALVAGEQLSEALEKRKFTPTALVPVYGVSLDKALALRGDATSTVRCIHSVELQEDDLIAFAVHRSKQLAAQKGTKAAVVEVPALPDAEQAPSANTRNRNPRKH